MHDLRAGLQPLRAGVSAACHPGRRPGRDALRAYRAHALRLLPDLRFTVEAVYAGSDAVVINYRNHRGNRVCEFLAFDGPLGVSGHGTHLTDSAAAASGLAASGQQG